MSETFLTNCPHCKSVFKLRREHLEVASGHVRCGNCHSLFLATDSLVSLDKETQKAQMDDTVEEAQDKVIEKAIPELTDEDKSEHYNLAIEAAADSGSHWFKWFFYSLSSLLLIFIALWFFYIWPNKQMLAQDSHWRPLMVASCKVFQCVVPPLQDLSRYRVTSIDVSESAGGQKEVSLILHNEADFAQPFPNIQIILSDIKGQLYKSPVFSPAQYLPEVNHNVLIEPGQSVQIAFSYTSTLEHYSGYQVKLVP